MPLAELLILLIVGLIAGAMGGMLGIGGSVIIIPALAIVIGPNQHLYQAAAMIVNVFVAVPATVQHARAGAIRWDVVGRLLPFGILAIILGVAVSDQIDGLRLQQVFGVFLIYVIGFNIVRLVRPRPEPVRAEQRTDWARTGSAGSVMGFLAGLLGIGGGAILVPLLQRVCNLPLRQCIAASAATMCITAGIGAVAKNATLSRHVDVQDPQTALQIADSLMLAGVLLPTAFLGGVLGATLTHRLPLAWVRLAFILLMSGASLRMLGVL